MSLSNAEIEENLERPEGQLIIGDNNAESLATDNAGTTDSRRVAGTGSSCKLKILKKMILFLRECIIYMLLILPYVSLQNRQPQVSKSPAAFPFFPENSHVIDYYKGELDTAIIHATKHDLSFVMYYAPWDAESQVVQKEFNIAALYMHRQVHFAAINCWQPGSRCRVQYNRVYSWPVLMIYPVHCNGIQYRGPRTSAHMVNFLQNAIRPITRITNEIELMKLRANHDIVVAGYLDTAPGSVEYVAFYTASLRFLELDPFRDIAFAVLSGSRIPQALDIQLLPTIKLYSWNQTLEYPADNPWHPDTIAVWVNENSDQVTMWLSPPGTKSQLLSRYLIPGPAMVLFTPKNPLRTFNDYYNVYREVGLEYYNCDNNPWVSLLQSMTSIARAENYLKYIELENKCTALREQKTDQFKTSSVVANVWLNTSCCLAKESESCRMCTDKQLFVSQEQLGSRLKTDSARLNDKSYSKSSATLKSFRTSMLNDENDARSAKNLMRFQQLEVCRTTYLTNKLHPVQFTFDKNEEGFNISGLSCKSNASLTMLVLDSTQLHHFAEGLGVDVLSRKDKTAVVILDQKHETHHIMKASFNSKNLRQFMSNFTRGMSERTLGSTDIERLYTHQYSTAKICQTDHVCVEDLTTANFLPTVLQANKAFVVLYHSVHCAFCGGVSHTLLAVAKILAPIKSIMFARIDGDSHGLPWEYTMHHYPTILFFPHTEKSESRAFPQNLPITVPNLLSFVLANLEPNVKLHAMWILCNQTKFEDELRSCMNTVRTESLSLIEKMLHEWRSKKLNSRQRALMLKKLQHLRTVHLLLAAPSNKNHSVINNHMTKLHLRYNKKQNRNVIRDEL